MALEGGRGAGGEDPCEEVPPEFECTICMKLLLDPVTVSCGHTFCRVCLEQSLGYRGLCAVCRAPIAAGQGVNVLVRSIIAERYPRALAQRREELQEEMLAGEREANEARHREARGATAGIVDRADGDTAVLLPLLRHCDSATVLLPHCAAELELSTAEEQRLLEYALRGPRRLGVLLRGKDGGYDDDARPLGVCLEIQDVVRRPWQEQQHLQQSVYVRLVGKFRFWLVEQPQAHEDGFELGRAEAFFDEQLAAAELALPAAEPAGAAAADAAAAADGPPPPVPVLEVATAALGLLERQLVRVGEGGRRAFAARFGEAPPLRGGGAGAAAATLTSAAAERLSFWLLGALVVEGSAERGAWLVCVDTRARLEHCRARLAAAGGRPALNLPGASSWMNPGQSAFSSFALLLVIVALFIAKAIGLFEKGLRGTPRQDAVSDAWVFGQLLR